VKAQTAEHSTICRNDQGLGEIVESNLTQLAKAIGPG
jgi:hypothetical protein